MSVHDVHVILMGAQAKLHCDLAKSAFMERGKRQGKWTHALHYGDADVWVARSVMLTQYAMENCSDAPVCVSLDHDTEYMPGAIEYIANYARNIDGMVGAVVAKKRKHGGINTRCSRDVTIDDRGSFELNAPHDFVGGGMFAITRAALRRIAEKCRVPVVDEKGELRWHDGLPHTDNVGVPFCTPYIKWVDGKWRTVREDVALCWRAFEASVPVHATAWPQITHHGDYGYTLRDAADPEGRIVEGNGPTTPAYHP